MNADSLREMMLHEIGDSLINVNVDLDARHYRSNSQHAEEIHDDKLEGLHAEQDDLRSRITLDVFNQPDAGVLPVGTEAQRFNKTKAIPKTKHYVNFDKVKLLFLLISREQASFKSKMLTNMIFGDLDLVTLGLAS